MHIFTDTCTQITYIRTYTCTYALELCNTYIKNIDIPIISIFIEILIFIELSISKNFNGILCCNPEGIPYNTKLLRFHGKLLFRHKTFAVAHDGPKDYASDGDY